MTRVLLASSFLAVAAASAVASPATAANATYILQVSSNLGCESLNVELLPSSGESVSHLTFSDGAFAAVDVQPGIYTFGKVTCSKDGETSVLNVLEGQLSPLNLTEEKIYFGGKLVFKQSSALAFNDAPDVLDNCPRHISRVRGTPNNSCRDGNGVDTGPKKIKKVDVFAPTIQEQEITRVRNSLQRAESEVAYLPLR